MVWVPSSIYAKLLTHHEFVLETFPKLDSEFLGVKRHADCHDAIPLATRLRTHFGRSQNFVGFQVHHHGTVRVCNEGILKQAWNTTCFELFYLLHLKLNAGWLHQYIHIYRQLDFSNYCIYQLILEK